MTLNALGRKHLYRVSFTGEGFMRIPVGLKCSGAKKYPGNRSLLLPVVHLSGESVPGISEEAVGRVDLSVGLGR